MFKIYLIGFLFSAQVYANNNFYDGLTGQHADLQQAISQIPMGAIVIVSEEHGFAPHQANQEKVILGLQQVGHQVDVAFEFVQRRFQHELNQYLSHQLEEESFLKKIEWGAIPFATYKPLFWHSLLNGGTAWGINADRRLVSYVAKSGIEGLTPEQQAEFPTQFGLGNRDYFERFSETMKDHVPAEKIERYFIAQSLWDDTMAFELKKLQQLSPERTLVVIVGDFHNSYGGGLPDRLRVRGAQHVYSISQLAVPNQSGEEEWLAEVVPHSKWGPRAEWVWVERNLN